MGVAGRVVVGVVMGGVMGTESLVGVRGGFWRFFSWARRGGAVRRSRVRREAIGKFMRGDERGDFEVG
jgi:hypothetical protein